MYYLNARVRYSEVDERENLTIVSLINYLQDAAAFHSEEVGRGLSHLTDKNEGWFITNWQLHIQTLPQYGEEIRISTWAYEMRGMFSKRNFLIENEAGERLVTGNSIWVLMNLETGKPARIPEAAIEAYRIEPPLDEDWGGRKIRLFDADLFEKAGEAEVMPVHLDTNRHMNNAYYIEIARDALPRGKKVFVIRAEYKKPTTLGDILQIYRATVDQTTQVELKNASGETCTVIEFQTD
ncbi:MAG: acyl-[Lachnospiraceae bacterium]|nr:acyl-[acyl-carrier-protein] thioesterase [Lachnospiraceae bacterium]